MAKINEYPQASNLNNNDLFVIDQTSGGDHATKSATMAQISQKATATLQTQVGDLSTLTTTNKSSLVGAVNSLVTDKSNKILVERKTAQVTMDNYYKSATISLTKTGYTAIGIVGYQTNTVGVVCFRNNIEGTNAIVGLVNRDGTTALGTNIDLYIDVLYLKN